MLIRPLRASDRTSIERLLIEADVFRDEEVAVALELVDIALQKPDQEDYRFAVAEVEGEAAGYACWGPTPGTRGTWDLYWIAAAPRFQGLGVGRALLTAAEKALSAEGGRLCVVETSSLPQYEPARRFYLRSGYREAARISDFYQPGDAKVVYTKAFGPATP